MAFSFFTDLKNWIRHIVLGQRQLIKIAGNIYLIAIGGIAVSIIWAAILRVRQGFRPGWFYLAAVCFLAGSIFKTCYVILTTNDLSVLVSPPTSIQIGLIIESLIIFAGIIYRYSVLKKRKRAGNKTDKSET